MVLCICSPITKRYVDCMIKKRWWWETLLGFRYPEESEPLRVWEDDEFEGYYYESRHGERFLKRPIVKTDAMEGADGARESD